MSWVNSWGAVLQGKLQGRLMEFSTPQPIDECLSILGESMVRDKEVTAVIGVYAKAVKDGEVHLILLPYIPMSSLHSQGLGKYSPEDRIVRRHLSPEAIESDTRGRKHGRPVCHGSHVQVSQPRQPGRHVC